MYYLNDGTIVNAAEIKKASEAGRAVLVHGRADGGTSTSLMLDGEHYDTRGTCYSVWDEVWTTQPARVQDALRAAYTSLDSPAPRMVQ